MSERVLFHVQHLLGIGHLQRAAVLSAAMAEAGLDVTLAYGGLPIREVAFHGVRVAPLPAATITGEDFSALRDAEGRPVEDAWKARRRDALLRLYRETRPHVVLIELYPFGRRQFAFELTPLIAAARAEPLRPALACSVRDILVRSKKAGREDAIVAALRADFDAVLVHGDKALIPLDATFAAAPKIADLVHYTGYVAQPAPVPSGEGCDEVLVSAGGGAVGGALLRAALGAKPLSSAARHRWRVLTGPNLYRAEFDALAASADADTLVERFRPDFAARLSSAALSISQAGYNTTMDILRSRVRAIVVPYETASETEQRLRADLLAERGFLAVVPAAELGAARLAAAIDAALAGPPPPPPGALDGAATTARLIAALAARTVG